MIRIGKRVSSLALAAAMILSLGACSGGSSTTTNTAVGEAGGTYTGTVAGISADSITVTTDNGDVAIPLDEDTVFSQEGGMDGKVTNLPGGMGSDEGDIPNGSGEAPDDMDGMPDGEMPAGGMASDGGTQNDMGGMPDGEMPADGMASDGGAPDDMDRMPADGMDSNREAPDGRAEGRSLTYEDISLGDTVTVVVGDDGVAESVTLSVLEDGMGGGNMNMPGGMSSGGVDSYDTANEYTEDTTVSDTELTSTGTDENTVLIQTGGITVTLDGVTVARTSDDSTGGDNSSFYGVGAANLVTAGTLIIQDSSITTDSEGGAGVFAYGDGVAYVCDSVIVTSKNTSGGIHVAGGGTLYAWDLAVTTAGTSSAAIRSDRGSGTMVVNGGTYTSNGSDSPAVYSTADIIVNKATLTATAAEAVCIEGLNTLRLFGCDLTGNLSDDNRNDCTWTVILYQSMSGDAEDGNSTFEMVGGSLTSQNGGLFYTTNTESTFILSGVDIAAADDCEFFLKCTGNSNSRGWGSTGSNGADCNFTAIGQKMEGDVIWDTISTLDLYILEGSTLTGAVINDESNAESGGSGYASLYIDADSSWVVTGSSALTNLYCAGTIVDENGSTVSIVGTDGTVYVSGTSGYTITVDSYSTSVDTSEASTVDSFSDYEVEKP